VERIKTMTKIKQFDASEYLDNEEVIAEYLTAALEENNPQLFLAALSDVAKARGMTKMASDAGLSRQSLYKTLSGDVKPQFDTIVKLVHAIGLNVSFTPAPKAAH
jgi:probable addiction module antidote protein